MLEERAASLKLQRLQNEIEFKKGVVTSADTARAREGLTWSCCKDTGG
jgi:hypothetical protein